MPRKRRRGAVPLRVKTAILRAVAAETAAPPPERAQHGEVETGGAVSRVDRLYRDGLIDRTHRDACSRLYRDWALGVCRISEPAGPGAGDAPDARELRYLTAATAYRRACEAVGDRAAMVLTLLVCEDASWAAIGQRLAVVEGSRPDEATVRAVSVLCIKDLAAYYEAPRKVRLTAAR